MSIEKLAEQAKELPPWPWYRRLWNEIRWTWHPYHDGALWVLNVPFLTFLKTHEGVMVYHDYYSDRQVWLPFPDWLAKHHCCVCGGIVWRLRYQIRNVSGEWSPLHERCARIVKRPLMQEWPR